MEMKRYSQIYSEMRDYVVAHQDKITDFNAGSVISSILEALAREIAALYLKTMANVDVYARSLAYSQFNFEKKGGLAASGSVVFSRNAASSSEVAIPAETRVATGSGIEFTTSAEVKILAGARDSASVVVACADVGALGNIRANMVDTIVGTLLGVDTVNNAAAFGGGVDVESEEDYHNRFREYILGLGRSSVPGIRATALAVNGIRSVSVVEHFPPADGFNFTLYAEDGSGYLPNTLKGLIQTALDGDDSEPGARACGITCRTLAPTVLAVNPSIVIRINWSIPSGLIEDGIRTKLTKYINSLKIGDIYDKTVVFNMLMNQSGVLEIISMTPDTTTPTGSQIIRLGTLTLESV